MQFLTANGRQPVMAGANSDVAIDSKNLGASLAKWLAERLTYLARFGTSYPGDLPSVETSEDWEAQLLYVADSLNTYATALESGPPTAAQAMDAQQAMHWVALHLHNLWD